VAEADYKASTHLPSSAHLRRRGQQSAFRSVVQEHVPDPEIQASDLRPRTSGDSAMSREAARLRARENPVLLDPGPAAPQPGGLRAHGARPLRPRRQCRRRAHPRPRMRRLGRRPRRVVEGSRRSRSTAGAIGSQEALKPGDPTDGRALGCVSMQELPMSNGDSAATQAAERAACSCSVAVPQPCVLGCELLQGLATTRGDVPASARTEAC
jgi:hypothetical protein